MESTVKKDFLREYCDRCNCSNDCAYKIRGLQCNDLDCIETGIEFSEGYNSKIQKSNKTIELTKEEAIKLYNSGNDSFNKIALRCFSAKELETPNFEDIKTFEDAVNAIGKDIDDVNIIVNTIKTESKATAAMYKLNIVRKALNLGHDLGFTKNPEDSYICYPYIPFIAKDSTYFIYERNSGEMEIIGKIKSDGIEYFVLSGYACMGSNYGISSFDPSNCVGHTNANFGFLGCANKEIAKHFGKYFGTLITEAKYGDLDDFEVIYDKYGNS